MSEGGTCEVGVGLGRGDWEAEVGGMGAVERNVLQISSLSASLLAMGWNVTNMPEGSLQLGVS